MHATKIIAAIVCTIVAGAGADQVCTYSAACDWECCEADPPCQPILGSDLDIQASCATLPDPVHSPDWSCRLVDQAATGTPQAYVAWIEGLSDGDVVTASIWIYDTTPAGAPSGRIWAHYTDNDLPPCCDPSALDINSSAGSAGGNSDYGPGTGWWQSGWTWTFDSAGGTRSGMVIEVRTYSNPGDTIWIDDLEVSVASCSPCGFIQTPCELVCIPEPGTLGLLCGGGALTLLRRKRR